MTNRRHYSDEDDRTMRLIEESLNKYFSMKKNGDTWTMYLWKHVTPQNILLVVLLIYDVGGSMQRVKSDFEALAAKDRVVTQQLQRVDAIVADQQGTQTLTAATVNRLQQQTDVLMAENEKFRLMSGRLNDQIRGAVTRSEFNAMIQQQMIPRFERIERKLGSQ